MSKDANSIWNAISPTILPGLLGSGLGMGLMGKFGPEADDTSDLEAVEKKHRQNLLMGAALGGVAGAGIGGGFNHLLNQPPKQELNILQKIYALGRKGVTSPYLMGGAAAGLKPNQQRLANKAFFGAGKDAKLPQTPRIDFNNLQDKNNIFSEPVMANKKMVGDMASVSGGKFTPRMKNSLSEYLRAPTHGVDADELKSMQEFVLDGHANRRAHPILNKILKTLGQDTLNNKFNPTLLDEIRNPSRVPLNSTGGRILKQTGKGAIAAYLASQILPKLAPITDYPIGGKELESRMQSYGGRQ